MPHGHLSASRVYLQEPERVPKVMGFGGWIDTGVTGDFELAATEAMLPYFENELGAEARRKDVRALGALLYLLLTGARPDVKTLRSQSKVTESPILQLRPTAPLALAEVAEQALELRGTRVFATAAQVRNALTTFLWGNRGEMPLPKAAATITGMPARLAVMPKQAATMTVATLIAPASSTSSASVRAPLGTWRRHAIAAGVGLVAMLLLSAIWMRGQAADNRSVSSVTPAKETTPHAPMVTTAPVVVPSSPPTAPAEPASDPSSRAAATAFRTIAARETPALLDEAIGETAKFLASRSGVLRVSAEGIGPRVSAELREREDLRVKPLEERLARIFDLPRVDLDACRAFMRPLFARSRVYEDAPPALSGLRARGVRLGILSNTPWGSPAELWREELARLGLSGAVDAVVFCRDVGWRKPDPRPFEFICRKLSVAPKDALFVGDDPRWDIEGPRRLGMDALLINRTGAAPRAGIPEDPQPARAARSALKRFAPVARVPRTPQAAFASQSPWATSSTGSAASPRSPGRSGFRSDREGIRSPRRAGDMRWERYEPSLFLSCAS